MHHLRNSVIAVLVLLVMDLQTVALAGSKKMLTIVNAQSINGDNLPLAEVLCSLVQENETLRRRCRARKVKGEKSWWEYLNQSPFAVVRSDLQHRQWKQVRGELRHLFALEMQPVLLLVPPQSRLSDFDAVLQEVEMHQFFGDAQDQKTLTEITQLLLPEINGSGIREFSESLCGNSSNVAIWMIASDLQNLESAFQHCKPRIIPIKGAAAQAAVKKLSYLGWGNIPKGSLHSLGDAVQTISLATTVVSTSKVPERLVFDFMAAIFDHFYRLQSLYVPAVSMDSWRFNPHRIFDAYRSTPLHEGAGRYYRNRLKAEMDLDWVVLASFKRFFQAEKLAKLLASRYPNNFPNGLQVRLGSDGLFGVIVGMALPYDAAQLRMEELEEQIPGVKSIILRDAFIGWSPQLLPLKPRVYPHAAFGKEKSVANGLAKQLQKQRWKVYKVAMTGEKSPSKSQFRYFKRSERLVAEKIFADLGGVKSGLSFRYVRGYEYSSNIRAMHFEFWIADD